MSRKARPNIHQHGGPPGPLAGCLMILAAIVAALLAMLAVAKGAQAGA